jgi:hypothetical protein
MPVIVQPPMQCSSLSTQQKGHPPLLQMIPFHPVVSAAGATAETTSVATQVYVCSHLSMYLMHMVIWLVFSRQLKVFDELGAAWNPRGVSGDAEFYRRRIHIHMYPI